MLCVYYFLKQLEQLDNKEPQWNTKTHNRPCAGVIITYLLAVNKSLAPANLLELNPNQIYVKGCNYGPEPGEGGGVMNVDISAMSFTLNAILKLRFNAI